MSVTQKYTKIRAFCAKHRQLMESVAMGILLGTMVSFQGDTPYQAHFLQRATRSQTHVERTSRPVKPVTPKKNVSANVGARTVVTLATTSVASKKAQSSSTQSVQLHAAAGSSDVEQSSAASLHAAAASSSAPESFPAFGKAIFPVASAPDWGAMTTAQEWERPFAELQSEEFVAIPSYNLDVLMTPMAKLLETRMDPATIAILTAKLFYSTRYFGAYDLDAGEFSAVHPGLDLKLAEDTPVRAVAGGRVHDIRTEDDGLGLYVVLEHRTPDQQTFYSVYGHLETAIVRKGDAVTSGQRIGLVGMTGQTSGPHLHLQIDRGEPNEANHDVYWPARVPSRSEAALHSINPITFIQAY